MYLIKRLGWAISLLMLGGCQDEKVLEKIGFVRTIAMDTAEGDEKALKVMISIPKTNQTDSIVYTDTARTFKQAKMRFDMQNDRKLVFGQLRQIMFGEKLARRGIWQPMDSVFRDPAVGIHTHVLVSEVDPGSYMSKTYKQGGTPGEYIDNLVRSDPATLGKFDSNLHTFLRDYYDDGIEPVATIIKETGQGLMVDGIALFVRDRYVSKIQSDDAMYFAMLRERVKGGSLFMDEVVTNRGIGTISIANVNSRRSISILSLPDEKHGKPAEVVLKIRIRGSLLEYDGLKAFNNIRTQPTLERAMEQYVGERLERLVGEMQKTGADALGVGIQIRNHMRYADWKALDWNREFSIARINVSVHLNIKDFGRLIDS